MGTRADFYIGRGKQAEWIGSIAWDGDEIPDAVAKAKTEKTYRNQVAKFFSKRDDATLPEQGWPWPWDDSNTTDVAYAFDSGRVYRAIGYPEMYWWRADQTPPDRDEKPPRAKPAEFPDMSAQRNVAMGSRSGLLVITPS